MGEHFGISPNIRDVLEFLVVSICCHCPDAEAHKSLN